RIAEDSDRLRRFAQEARASAALEHPNIVAVHDIGTHETQPYIVSELLDGDPLNRRIDGRPIPVDDLLDLALQIADGLDAALGQVNPAVPVELQKIVDRCLQKRPEARYQQARDVLGDLRALRRLRDSRASGSVAKAAPSIAVLPFADMSPQRDQEYFCEGMAE